MTVVGLGIGIKPLLSEVATAWLQVLSVVEGARMRGTDGLEPSFIG